MLKKFEDRVEELKLALRNKNKEIAQVMSFDGFKSKHTEFTFPLTDCKTFDTFNVKLKDDEKGIRTNMKIHIQTITDPVTDAKDNINTIFQNLISTKILVSHTAENSAKTNRHTSTSEKIKTKDKPTMHKTEFFKVVRDSSFGLYNTESNPRRLDERIILNAIGGIINSRRSSGNNRDLEEVSAETEH
ncbi:hypothetical protein QAD02_023849 [Eretmocerus hayati]|uniref:Uncharacterized protein n=1 Tax=Eretmocerus hayati TaxID=131215 RepID=A0ACC2PZF9_9HYME|nr:hypothetical protein QAD02_023849 [Eretmocerus hayati]